MYSETLFWELLNKPNATLTIFNTQALVEVEGEKHAFDFTPADIAYIACKALGYSVTLNC